MSFSVVIPARFAANRLPGKPLLDICGKPMIQHTYEKALASKAKSVTIATDDHRIKDVAESFGAQVCMTSSVHTSGTDRIQEVAAQLKLKGQEVIVNVQADEPLLPPAAINQVAQNGIATLCELVTEQGEIDDANAVKVVMDKDGQALYFSRSTLPWQASTSAQNCYRHIGIYAYRVVVLNQFVQWPVSELELSEKLEQLRALHNGVKIHVAVTNQRIPPGVDTERDLDAVRALLTRSD
jgi:3-deoxy-manno-octulosonate cytidylyltransferase (CMP-KDO synthetase)